MTSNRKSWIIGSILGFSIYLSSSSYVFVMRVFPETWIMNALFLGWITTFLSFVINFLLSAFVQPGYVENGRIYEESSCIMNGQEHAQDQIIPLSLNESVCTKCHHFRPPRSHHCRRCGKCVLKMDHHCFWIDNCVGYYNLGHFTRCLFSATLTMIYGFVLIFLRIYEMSGIASKTGQLPFGFPVLAMISFNIALLVPVCSIVVMLSYNQLHYVLQNMTAIEDAKRRDEIIETERHPYDRGWFENVCEVLGPSPLFWMIPQYMPQDIPYKKWENR